MTSTQDALPVSYPVAPITKGPARGRMGITINGSRWVLLDQAHAASTLYTYAAQPVDGWVLGVIFIGGKRIQAASPA